MLVATQREHCGADKHWILFVNNEVGWMKWWRWVETRYWEGEQGRGAGVWPCVWESGRQNSSGVLWEGVVGPAVGLHAGPLYIPLLYLAFDQIIAPQTQGLQPPGVAMATCLLFVLGSVKRLFANPASWVTVYS